MNDVLLSGNISSHDFLQLLKCAKKLEKEMKAAEFIAKDCRRKVKIAVLGSYTVSHFVSVFRFMLYQQNIYAEIYQGEYGGLAMDALDSNSDLYVFAPDIVIIFTHHTDIKVFPQLLADCDSVNQSVDAVVGFYETIWRKISSMSGCHILQTNFVAPSERVLGNLECNYVFSKQSFYQRINLKLTEKRAKNVSLVDIEHLAARLGKDSWFDESGYFLSKNGFKLNYVGQVADVFAKQVQAVLGATKKCIVLDLDNTLWGGVVGDCGYDGIQVDPNHPIGEAYLAFQSYLLELKERGVLLAVCSKNDEAIAKEPFLKNANMVLHLHDFAAFVANWEDKAGNIAAIARAINIGTDSLVFFDDNPAERAIVQQYLPMVYVVDVPEDPAQYVRALDRAQAFEWTQLTAEDLSRNITYQENTKRVSLESSFVDYEDYLRALKMTGAVERVKGAQLERFTQLLNKTNQFNLRTMRYSEAAIEKMQDAPNNRLLCVTLKDIYSDYGIISCIILQKHERLCFIDSWVMSCRVLRRGVEQFAFKAVCKAAAEMGCTRLLGEYIPSNKNAMVKDFYQRLGFKSVDGEKNSYPSHGEFLYDYDLSDTPMCDTQIQNENNFMEV